MKKGTPEPAGPGSETAICRRQELEQCIVEMARVLDDLECLPPAPLLVDVIYRGELTSADLLRCPNNPLYCSAAVSSAVPVPEGNAACKDTLNGTTVKSIDDAGPNGKFL